MKFKLKVALAILAIFLVTLMTCASAFAHGHAHGSHNSHHGVQREFHYSYTQGRANFDARHREYHHGRACKYGDDCPFYRNCR